MPRRQRATNISTWLRVSREAGSLPPRSGAYVSGTTSGRSFSRVLPMYAHQDPLDPAPLHFRRLEVADFPLMQRWLTGDAVGEWWGKREWTLEEVLAKYTPRIEGKDLVQ